MRNRRPVHHRSARRGFSFAEVLFAVMILGLGFILVAAIFPVAIRQQQASMEDATGVAIAKRASAMMQQMGTAFAQYNPNGAGGQWGNFNSLNQDLAGKVYGSSTNVVPAKSRPVLVRFQAPAQNGGNPPYRFIKGDLIQESDRRLAWFPVAYASKHGSAYADVYLVAVQSRANELFTDFDRDASEDFTKNGPFTPVDCHFKLVEGDSTPVAYPDTIVFTNASGTPQDASTNPDYGALAEGAYVWVADDNITSTPASPNDYAVPGSANGRCYRLGIQRTDLGVGVWELQPGYDMTTTLDPGPNQKWENGTNDDVRRNENLPPREVEPNSSHPYATGNYTGIAGTPARGLLVGRGRERTGAGTYGNFVGGAMTLYAPPPVTVRIQP